MIPFPTCATTLSMEMHSMMKHIPLHCVVSAGLKIFTSWIFIVLRILFVPLFLGYKRPLSFLNKSSWSKFFPCLNFRLNQNFCSYGPQLSSSEGPTYKHCIVRRGKGNFALTKMAAQRAQGSYCHVHAVAPKHKFDL
jgi:hypothetical protein